MKAVRLLSSFAGALLLFGLVRWAAPVHGLAGRIYLDETRTGEVVNTFLDERIFFGRRDFVERAGRSDHVGIVWEGFVRIARPATFRFTLRSDDGSWLYIDDHPAIDNGGIHAVGQFDVDIPLAAGTHKIRVDYFNAAEDGRIELSWRRKGVLRFLWPLPRFTPGPLGPGAAALDLVLTIAGRILGLILIALGAVLVVTTTVRFRRIAGRVGSWARGTLEAVRSSARSHPGAFLAGGAGLIAIPIFLLVGIRVFGPVRGLSGTYFANASWEGKPVLAAVDPSIHFEKSAMIRRAAALGGPASAVWEGVLSVPGQSVYRFELISDDGSTLELDGKLLVDNGGFHPSRRAFRDILLARGDHPVRIKYFDAGDGGHMDAFVRRKGGLWPGFVPAARFYPKPPGPTVRAIENGLVPLKLVLVVAAVIAAGLFLLGLRLALGALPERMEPLFRPVRPAFDKAVSFLRKRTVLLLILFALVWLIAAGGKALLPVHGMTARYYPGLTAKPPVALETHAPVISFHNADLRARIGGSGPVSISYEGYLLAPKSSTYRFSVVTGEAVAVTIDDRTVVEAGAGASGPDAVSEVPLDRGSHRIGILYTSASGKGSLDFRWAETRTPRLLMPPLRLYPDRPKSGVVLTEVVLPAAISLLNAVRAIAGAILVLLALGAALPKGKVFAAVPFVLIAITAVIYFGQVLARRSTAVEGCDTYAYLQGAEIIAREGPFRTGYTDPLVPAVHSGFATRPEPDKEMFVLAPHGYYVQDLDRGEVVNTFPPGMSMLLAPVILAAGRGAAFWFVPVLALLLFAGFFALGTKAVDPVFGLGLAAAALLNESVFSNTILVMSDVPSLALVSLSAYLLYRNTRRASPAWPLLAGAIFGLSLLVRYSNIAAAVPLALLLWAGRGPEKRAHGFFRDGALFTVAASLTGLLPLGIYTALLFGTPFRLVYDPVNVSRISLANIPIGASFYLGSLWGTFGPAGMLLALIGFFAALARRAARSAALVGLAGLAAFFAFYSMQSIRQDRYLVPAYAFLALLSALGLLELTRAARRSRLLVTLLLAAAVAVPLARSFGPLAIGLRGADAIAAQVKARVGGEPVVFCDQLSGPLRLYAGIPGYRFSWTDPEVLTEIIGTLERNGRTVYFLLDNPIAEDRFQAARAAVPRLSDRLIREEDLGRMPFYRWGPGPGVALLH